MAIQHRYRLHSAIWVAEGLRAGLAQFAGATQVALVLGGEDEAEVLDTQKLLFNLAKLDQRSVVNGLIGSGWSADFLAQNKVIHVGSDFGDLATERQDWFVKTAMEIVPKKLVEEWMQEAARLLLGAFNSDQVRPPPGASASSAVESYAVHNIGSYLADRSEQGIIYPEITNALKDCAKISQSIEEGTRASGTIAFYNFDTTDPVEMFAEFEQSFRLTEYKRIGKILQAVKDDGCLISDYKSVVGISRHSVADAKAISINFKRGIGAVRHSGQTICRIVDGQFRCAESEDTSKIVSRHLQNLVSSACAASVGIILEAASEKRHGCTVVVELTDVPKAISGERIKKPFLLSESTDEIVRDMAKIDGAIHIDKEGRIHGFGCLLDGTMSSHEDRSRGARFNSGLRFSIEREDVLVLVVSSDGPLTIFRKGQAIYADPFSQPDHYRGPGPNPNLIPVSLWIKNLGTPLLVQ